MLIIESIGYTMSKELLFLLFFASIIVFIGQDQLAILLREGLNIKLKSIVPYWNTLRWLLIILLLFYGNAFIYKFAKLLM